MLFWVFDMQNKHDYFIILYFKQNYKQNYLIQSCKARKVYFIGILIAFLMFGFTP